MLDRFGLSFLVIAIALITYALLNQFSLSRLGKKPIALENFLPGIPGILYFTTPDCMPCKTIQRPALTRLLEKLGDQVQVHEVNALAEKSVADHWGVLSVPTLFLIDSSGKPRGVLRGVTPTEKMIRALEEIEGKTFDDQRCSSNQIMSSFGSD